MALKGNLRDFTITQLLNLVSLAKKTGTLRIKTLKKDAQLSFSEGKLTYASVSTEENNLSIMLLYAKTINARQFRLIKSRAANKTDKALGLMLINAGYMSQEKIFSSLRKYYQSIIKRLYSWQNGQFEFVPTVNIPPGKITVKLSLENIIIEGARQLQEFEKLNEELPNLDISMRFSKHPNVDIRNLNLSASEWRVVSYINPKNTIQQIAKVLQMSDLEIRKVVYGLLQAGLIVLIRPEDKISMLPGVKEAIPGKDKKEQMSLVNRLLKRIRSI
jgi:hypothetical protein